MTEASPNRTIKLADVAKAAGVSQGTVSNVFNRPEIVRPELRERVHAAARRIGYRGPDPKGRLLRAGKVNAIGVVTNQPLSCFFECPFERILLAGISEACAAKGTGISLVSVADKEALNWNISNALVDGFILICLSGAEELITSSRERQLPFVGIALDRGAEIMSVITADNVEGGRKAAAHLVGLGHERFAVLTLELGIAGAGKRTLKDIEKATLSEAPDRLAGSFEVLAAHGIDLRAVPIYEKKGSRSVALALEELFSSETPPTALIAQSDHIATIAMNWLKAHGYNVPGDVSIVGFDDVPGSESTDPPLTTIRQPIREMGRRAAEVILEQPGEMVHETFEVELIVRGSTGSARG